MIQENDQEVVEIIKDLLIERDFLNQTILIVTDNPQIFWGLSDFRFNKRLVSCDEIDNLIVYYRINCDKTNMIVASLDLPRGRHGSRLIGLKEITKRQLVTAIFMEKG